MVHFLQEASDAVAEAAEVEVEEDIGNCDEYLERE